jgi:hypothetical protein
VDFVRICTDLKEFTLRSLFMRLTLVYIGIVSYFVLNYGEEIVSGKREGWEG